MTFIFYIYYIPIIFDVITIRLNILLNNYSENVIFFLNKRIFTIWAH